MSNVDEPAFQYPASRRILCVVEANPDTERLVEFAAERHGYRIWVSNSLDTMVSACQRFSPEAVVLSGNVPGLNVLEALRSLARLPSCPKLILSASKHRLREAEIVAGRLGLRIVGCLERPIDIDELDRAIRMTLIDEP